MTSLAILQGGLVCGVGLDAASACAAIRASATNFQQTRFTDRWDEQIVAAEVDLGPPTLVWDKLVAMAGRAIRECSREIDGDAFESVPLLLCVSEPGRPGRLSALDASLLDAVQRAAGARFHPTLSRVVPGGGVAALQALQLANSMVLRDECKLAIIAGADSFLLDRTLTALERDGRLLTSQNSDGFIPAEGGSALLVGRPTACPSLLCTGLGFGVESATLGSALPQRADGLVHAFKEALREARCDLGDIDWRIADLCGEQYFFKEAALALTRALRTRKAEMPLWHPADVLGNIGAAAGAMLVTVALFALRRGYAPGARLLCHAGNDAGQRGAAILEFVKAGPL